jgi:hypothetical protein
MRKAPDRLEQSPVARDLREARLQQIRREAQHAGLSSLSKSTALTPQATPETGYYGLPILKKPQWKKEIPLYFFCGGAAGAAAILASVAQLTGADEQLIRDGRYLAAIAGAVSPALLIADLGMPSRFLNMLRVFKVQSPMSVGSWTLVAFSSSATAAAFLNAWQRGNSSAMPIKILESASQFISTITGAVLLTYTGVLLGATAIPVWNQNAKILPAHFATSGLAAAGALLELRGHQAPALNAIGIATALAETAVGASIELRKNPALKPLKSGRSGWLTRLGGLLAGPVPLLLRLLALGGDKERSMKLRKIAAASSVAGSLATRFAWTQAGATSAMDTPLLLDGDSDKLAEKPTEKRARLTEAL